MKGQIQEHSFRTDIAAKYGIQAAIMLKYIHFWVTTNKANNRNLEEGKYWSYNSINAFCEIFEYLSAGQIRRTLAKLIEAGLIEKGEFNQTKYDRTSWYTLTDEAWKLFTKSNVDIEKPDLSKSTNGAFGNNEPIPDKEPIKEPIKEPYISKADVEQVFDEFWEEYPLKKEKKKAKAIFTKLKLTPDLFDTIMSALKQQKQSYDWVKKDGEFIPYPTTWLNGARWEDEISDRDIKLDISDPEKYKNMDTTGWKVVE